MARQIITLRYASKCADCGTPLAVGDKGRYYGRGITYGVDCHPQRNGNGTTPAKPKRVTKVQMREQLEIQGRATAQRLIDEYNDTRDQLVHLEELNARAAWLHESN